MINNNGKHKPNKEDFFEVPDRPNKDTHHVVEAYHKGENCTPYGFRISFEMLERDSVVV
jgi:hypothetical protein